MVLQMRRDDLTLNRFLWPVQSKLRQKVSLTVTGPILPTRSYPTLLESNSLLLSSERLLRPQGPSRMTAHFRPLIRRPKILFNLKVGRLIREAERISKGFILTKDVSYSY